MALQLSLFDEPTPITHKPTLSYAMEVLTNRVPPDPDAPIVVSYGGGRNSTAMLIGMWGKGIVPDLILFSDTGGEKPGTYEYIGLFDEWLISKEMPGITVISREKLGMNKQNRYSTLEGQCLANGTLPSKAYGLSTCSLNWKKEPFDRYVKGVPLLKKWWEQKKLVRKFIGFHAGETSRLFNKKSGNPFLEEDKFFIEYPLIQWEWHQGHCESIIQAAGLPMPPKSACFFCPNTKANEIRRLQIDHPDLVDRAIVIERNHKEQKGKDVKGLGRQFSWEELIESGKPNGYFVNNVIPDCMCNDG
jgi:hypothetical protein